MSRAGFQAQIEDDPAIVADLIARSQASIEALKRDIRTKSGTDLLDFILEDVQLLRQSLTEPRNFAAIMAGMNAATWINEQMMAWLGEKNAADTLAQSAPNNVTSEMGLALLDVADVIRPHPEVIAYLQHAKDDGFLEGLLPLAGGPEAHDALRAYLDKYGMRCVGEIDVTRTRWSEAPTTLVPLILGNIRNFEPGAGSRKFEQGRQEAAKKEQELLERLKQLPDGEQKAAETQRMISRLRNFIGYREYPKYGIINRYFVYKQALLEEAGRLVRANVLQSQEDIYYLTLQELREVVRTHAAGRPDRQPAEGRARAQPEADATAGLHVRWGDRRRGVQASRSPRRRPGRSRRLRGRRRGTGPRPLRNGRCRAGSGGYPGHRLHGPELDALVRVHQGPGDRGGWADDPRRGDRPGIRLAGGRRRGERDPVDPGWAAHPRAWNRRIRGDPGLRAEHGGARAGKIRQ